MSHRAKKQKIHPDRDTIAAYAASQPLFSALRNAITSLETTKANLTVARDIVQSLHVKIANDDRLNEQSRHDAYINAAVKAWVSSTDAFCKVFEELVTVTAADPSEGREAGPRHSEFVGILQSVKRARELAADSSSSAGKENKSTPSIQDEEQYEERALEDSTEALEPAPDTNELGKRVLTKPGTDAEKRATTSPAARYNKTGEKILWQHDELRVSYDSLDVDEKRAWKVIASRKKHAARTREQKPADGRSQTATGARSDNTVNTTMHPEQPILQSRIEFEDISARVEARLKVKAEKRAVEKAKKTEKKRKRESGDAWINGAREDTGKAGDGLGQPLVEKPVVKRAKKGANNQTGSQVNGSAAVAAQTTARKRKDTEAEIVGAGGATGSSSRNKRKKA